MDTELYIDTEDGEETHASEPYEFFNKGVTESEIQGRAKDLTEIYYFEEACCKDLDEVMEYKDKDYENFINGCQ